MAMLVIPSYEPKWRHSEFAHSVSVFCLGILSSPWFWLIFAVAIVAVATWDLILRPRRDWLHWIGVGVIGGLMASNFVVFAQFHWQ